MYEVYVDGKFYELADSVNEARSDTYQLYLQGHEIVIKDAR
jgi:hypothetical protein